MVALSSLWFENLQQIRHTRNNYLVGRATRRRVDSPSPPAGSDLLECQGQSRWRFGCLTVFFMEIVEHRVAGVISKYPTF
jgi:hypothetical protein